MEEQKNEERTFSSFLKKNDENFNELGMNNFILETSNELYKFMLKNYDEKTKSVTIKKYSIIPARYEYQPYLCCLRKTVFYDSFIQVDTFFNLPFSFLEKDCTLKIMNEVQKKMEDIKLVYSFGKIFFIQNPLDHLNRILQNIELFKKNYLKFDASIINYIKSFKNSFDLNDYVIKIKYIDDFIFNNQNEMEEIINILNNHFKKDFLINGYQNQISILKYEKPFNLYPLSF